MCKPIFFIQAIVVFWISGGIFYSSQILNGTYWNNSSDTWSRVCTFLWEHYPCQVPWHNSCLMAVLTLAREEVGVLRCPWTGFARFSQFLIDQSWRSSSGAGWNFLPSSVDALFVNDKQGSLDFEGQRTDLMNLIHLLILLCVVYYVFPFEEVFDQTWICSFCRELGAPYHSLKAKQNLAGFIFYGLNLISLSRLWYLWCGSVSGLGYLWGAGLIVVSVWECFVNYIEHAEVWRW